MIKLLNDLKKLPRFTIISADRKNDIGYGKCSHFLIRWWRRSEVGEKKIWVVEFSVRKHFDRWSNSTNFACEFQYCRKLYRPDIKDAYKWMVKVVKSGLFNWDRYYGTLDIQCEFIANSQVIQRRN